MTPKEATKLSLLSIVIFNMPTGTIAAESSALTDDHDLVIEESGEMIIEPEKAISIESEISIEQPGQVNDLVIEEGADPVKIEAPEGDYQDHYSVARDQQFELKIDDAKAEFGYFTKSGSPSDHFAYGRVTGHFHWQVDDSWDLRLAGRLDGYNETSNDSFPKYEADYGDSFVRFRGENTTITAGTQTILWGRLDELPPSDVVSTVDLRRYVLDELSERRLSSPAVRVENHFESGKLDLVWLVDFRPASLGPKEGTWYPIDTTSGRSLGFSPDDLPPASIVNAAIDEDAPSGDGGFGARYTGASSGMDFGLTVARTRQSIPYFRSDGPGRLQAEYPRSWAVGGDMALEQLGATWRFEAVYKSDVPVTKSDLSYTTTPSILWGGGVEFHPGDGDTRVNLQLVGSNLLNHPSVLDRSDVYSIIGDIEIPLDRNRWRAELGFYLGLDEKDIYLNPKISFLGWEPHEFYLTAYLFSGDDNTFGGFYEDNSSLGIGWQAQF